jgi:hypothetical protein
MARGACSLLGLWTQTVVRFTSELISVAAQTDEHGCNCVLLYPVLHAKDCSVKAFVKDALVLKDAGETRARTTSLR